MLSGKELKNFRKRRKLSLRDVAKYANLSISTISDVENGVIKVNENNHKAIADGINEAYAERVYDKHEANKKAETESKPEVSVEPEKEKFTLFKKKKKVKNDG